MSDKRKIPLAVNILKFQRYNFSYFSCEEVVLFEYFVVKCQSFKYKQFFHSSATISSETGIKKHSLETIIRKFQKLGYLDLEVKGMPKTKYFTVNMSNIYKDLPLIYTLEENGKVLFDFRKLLDDYYQPLVENYLLKNNNKNIKNNDNTENVGSSSEVGNNIALINSFLFELKNKNHLTPAQLKADDSMLINTLRYYDGEEIKKYIASYFKDYPNKKFNEFLRHDNLAAEKNLYIETKKREEEEDLQNVIENLQNTFNKRRKNFTEDKNNKRGKSKTTFVVNNRSKEKLKQALKIFGEIGIENAFIAYCDEVLKGEETPEKFMPYFLANPEGEFGVIEQYLDHFNINYGYEKN